MYENSLDYARRQDEEDVLKHFRQKFYIPEKDGKPVIYFCGNSLGLQPRTVRQEIETELADWQKLAVEAHFHGKNPWFYYHERLVGPAARVVGALPHEVAVMNALTVNLHLLMVSFYQPSGTRCKILAEAGSFPSDRYAFESQIRLHGLDPKECLVEIGPREGENTIRTEDLVEAIEKLDETLALVIIGGVNFYSGQAFEMDRITQAAHAVGAIAGFDLAHAAGNLWLHLHDWGVDFAAWCTYKYLNSGPGGVGGAFVHERWADAPELPRLAGWWGFDEKTRFKMEKHFQPSYGASGWQLSNEPILSMAAHKAALEIFDEAGMEALSAKSRKLTGYLEFLINEYKKERTDQHFEIITPDDPGQRGAQLSIRVAKNGKALFQKLVDKGVVPDWREPDVIRVAPVPLYNTFEEVYRFAQILAGGI